MARKKPPQAEASKQVTSSGDAPSEAKEPSRPVRLEYVRAGSLSDNPENWRRHPLEQRHTLADQMAQVGWAGACLFNERTGRLLDGHLRKSIVDPDDEIPVLIGSWSEDEERTILATLDPISAMAQADGELFANLADQVDADSRWVRDLFDRIAASAKADDPADAPAADEEAMLPEMERHAFEHWDYIVLMFRDDQDFQSTCELLGVRKVEITYPGGMKKTGLGRVVDGARAVAKLRAAGPA